MTLITVNSCSVLLYKCGSIVIIITILFSQNVWADLAKQTLQTQIRLLLRSSLIRVYTVCHSIYVLTALPNCSFTKTVSVFLKLSQSLEFARYQIYLKSLDRIFSYDQPHHNLCCSNSDTKHPMIRYTS